MKSRIVPDAAQLELELEKTEATPPAHKADELLRWLARRGDEYARRTCHSNAPYRLMLQHARGRLYIHVRCPFAVALDFVHETLDHCEAMPREHRPVIAELASPYGVLTRSWELGADGAYELADGAS